MKFAYLMAYNSKMHKRLVEAPQIVLLVVEDSWSLLGSEVDWQTELRSLYGHKTGTT